MRVKVAALGVVALAGVGGGVAYAYPPDMPLSVAATAGQVTNGQATVTVTVSNANPGCQTRVTVDGVSTTLPAGTTVLTTTTPANSGRHRVRARTVNCRKQNEHARNTFVISNVKISGPTSGPARSQLKFELTGLQPGDVVTLSAVNTSGPGTYADTDTADKRGEATVKFKPKDKGTYAVSASVNGTQVSATSVTVN